MDDFWQVLPPTNAASLDSSAWFEENAMAKNFISIEVFSYYNKYISINLKDNNKFQDNWGVYGCKYQWDQDKMSLGRT